ncbi:MAG TPA: MlaD family protein [Thermoleophilaceae bacterium]|nr:MlaD family protein [Thermoleophilaceae bacterium]
MRAPGAVPLKPYAIAVGLIVGLVLVTWFSFNPRLPFSSGYRVHAVFQSSNGLRDGSPVRVAGITVGAVVDIGEGPGNTTVVTIELKDSARPVRRDATVRIRPRVFLEGGFLAELQPGSPSAPELRDGGTIPLAQTSIPVQFHQTMDVLDHPGRQALRTSLDAVAGGLADGGADGLRTLAPELRPLLRDTAWFAEAARGTRPDDVSRLVRATSRVAAALDRPPERLGSLVDNLAVTASAVRSRDTQLSASIAELNGVLRATPAAVRALDAGLPALERAGRHVGPALPIAPRAFRDTTAAVRSLGRLTAPGRRARTIAALETAFRDVPGLVGRLARAFPDAKPLADCLSSHVLPLFNAKVPDGALSTGRPVWQDLVHSTVGLAGASQNFDANGPTVRYQLGIGGQSLAAFPGAGELLASAPGTLRSRPLPRPDRTFPPLNSRAPCSRQPQPVLATPSGAAGFQPLATPRATTKRVEMKELLDPESLERVMRGDRP